MVQSRAAAKKKTGDIWGDDEGSGSHGAFSSPSVVFHQSRGSNSFFGSSLTLPYPASTTILL